MQGLTNSDGSVVKKVFKRFLSGVNSQFLGSGGGSLLALCWLLSSGQIQAATYSWDGNGTPNASGNWSVTNNWNPDATTGGPTTGDIATLVDTTANRTVTYDSSATGSLSTLNFNQATAGVTNTLSVQKNLNVAGAVTLAAAGGTEQIVIGSTSTAAYTFTPTSGLTLNSGGELVMTATGNGTTGFNSAGTGGTGTLTIAGGALTIAGTTGTSSGTSAASTLSMGLTMSSGNLTIANNTGITDRRLLLQGAVNVSGGAVSTTGGATSILFTTASPIIWNPTTFDTDLTLEMNLAGAQSLTTDKTISTFRARETGVKTLTSTATGNGIGQLQLFDNNSGVANSRTTIRLGSDLKLTNGAAMPAAQSFGNTHQLGRIDLGIDTAGYTLDLSGGASSGVWTPNASTQSGVTSTVWTLSGAGAIKANAFNFTTAGVTTDVASGTVLLASGGNSVANNLGGTGTIDPNSVFRYSGTAASGTPATLTSSRNLGDIEVTSGALRMLTASAGTVQDLRVSGGTFNLDANNGRTFTTISLTGGTLANGTFATAETDYTGLATGTVSGILTGANKKLIKDSAGTLTLSGNNSFTGAVQIKSGTLALAPGYVIAGNDVNVMGGTLDLGNQNLNKFNVTLTSDGVITNGSILRTSATSYNWSDGTVAANLTTTGTGAINLTKSGSGTVVLSGSTDYVGTTTISGGTLQVGNGGASGRLGSGNVLNNGTLAFSRSDDFTLANSISGSGSLLKQGANSLTLSANNGYTGATAVSSGTLVVQSGGSIGSSLLTTVGTGAHLKVNGTAGAVSIAGTLSGSGTVGAMTLSSGGTLAAGNSPGLLRAASATWNPGATFQFEISNANGTAGSDWDLFSVNGNLDMTTIAASSQMNLSLLSLSLANYDPNTNYSWVFAKAASLTGTESWASGLDVTDRFAINSSGFNGGVLPDKGFKVMTGTEGGLATLSVVAVPEPSTHSLLLIGGGLTAVLFRRRIGKRT
jgi:autotransporter-associated beta strand protein